jgi:putative membrane protein
MMYGWWDYGSPVPWYGMIFGPIMMAVFAVVVIAIIAYLIRASGERSPSNPWKETPLDILQNRFARGEIDRAEYEERRHLLSGS